MLIGPAGDALALRGGQENRAAEGGRADKDLGGFFGHEQGTEDGFRGRADGDDTVVLE